MWYVEALMWFGTVASVLGFMLGAAGLALFRSPRFVGHMMSGLVGFALDFPALVIVHRSIN